MKDQILEILSRSNVFLTGGGGVGKSYLTASVVRHYKENFKNVIILGSTGISAVSLGGVSLHSFFKFGYCKDYEELRRFDYHQKDKLSKLRNMLDACDLLVIDEISMVSSDLMEMIRYRLLTSKFKGRVLIVGDFYQLPPVQKEQNENRLFNFLYAFNSSAWEDMKFTNVELLVSKRTNDLKFYEILSRLRVGELDDEIMSYIESLRVTKIEPDDDTSVLFGRNAEAEMLNQKRLSELSTSLEISNSDVSILDENLDKKEFEKWANTLNISRDLEMKIGAKIIFTSNKWGEYYNGEQGKIMQILKENGVISSVIVKKDSGEICEIEKAAYIFSSLNLNEDEIEENVQASLYQFPFKLAYALTIHKSQGMSINSLICNINHIFAKGQLYVALSRAVSPKNLKLFYDKKSDFRQHLRKVVKIDDEVKKFYQENVFLHIKENL